MLDSNYFQSLSQELYSLKNRVRNFIRDKHWQTDGEWKESVVRAVLRRHLPKSVQIGRGFVITNDGPSKQIDILIYDSTKPILFQDGDLVFITRDAVIGIIEVKSSLSATKFRQSLETLCANAELVERSAARERVYGLFAFEDKTGDVLIFPPFGGSYASLVLDAQNHVGDRKRARSKSRFARPYI